MIKNIDDYLDRGMKGNPETKPSERREYLTQLRERIIIALTNGQVLNKKVYYPLEDLMKRYPQCHLYLDGELGYQNLSKYVRLANANKVPFTMVDDKQFSTKIGLVLSNATAIDKENIFVEQEEFLRHLR
ncbi:YueI family protein [Sutcliffiella cohnii]